MSLLVKICGLTDTATLDAALDAGADMVGFVFFEPSPRHLFLEQARQLFDRARGRATICAVTVDPDDDLIDGLIDLQADALQLHGRETPERVAAIKADTEPMLLVKAIPVSEASDLDRALRYGPIVDRLLLDAKPPAGATLPGGNGLAFDWGLIAGYDFGLPFMLSGGLTPENVGDAIRLIGHSSPCIGIDVSSGVESAPGVKDPARIHAFIAASRAADALQSRHA